MSNSLISQKYELMKPMNIYSINNDILKNINYNKEYENINFNIKNNVRDNKYNTLLHQFIISNDEKKCFKLINKITFDISNLYNAINIEGNTVLHLLCKNQYYNIYKMLIGEDNEIEKELEKNKKYIDEIKDNNKKYKDRFNYYIFNNNHKLPIYYLFKGIEPYFKEENINYFKYLKKLLYEELITLDEEELNLYLVLENNDYIIKKINKNFINEYFQKIKNKEYNIKKLIFNENYKLTYKDYFNIFLTKHKNKNDGNLYYFFNYYNYNKYVCRYILKKILDITDYNNKKDNYIYLNYVNSVIYDNEFNKIIFKIIKSEEYKDILTILNNETLKEDFINELNKIITKFNYETLINIFNNLLKDFINVENNDIKNSISKEKPLLIDGTEEYNKEFQNKMNKIIDDDKNILIKFSFIYKIAYYILQNYENNNNNEIILFIKNNEINRFNKLHLLVCIKLLLENRISFNDLNKPLNMFHTIKYTYKNEYNDTNIKIDKISYNILPKQIFYYLILNQDEDISLNFLNTLLSYYPSINYCLMSKILYNENYQDNTKFITNNDTIKEKILKLVDNNIKYFDSEELLIEYYLSILFFNNNFKFKARKNLTIKDLILDIYNINQNILLNLINDEYNLIYFFNITLYSNNNYNKFLINKPILKDYQNEYVKLLPFYNSEEFLNGFNFFLNNIDDLLKNTNKEIYQYIIPKNKFLEKYNNNFNITDFMNYAFDIKNENNKLLNKFDIKNIYKNNICDINNIILSTIKENAKIWE